VPTSASLSGGSAPIVRPSRRPRAQGWRPAPQLDPMPSTAKSVLGTPWPASAGLFRRAPVLLPLHYRGPTTAVWNWLLNGTLARANLLYYLDTAQSSGHGKGQGWCAEQRGPGRALGTLPSRKPDQPLLPLRGTLIRCLVDPDCLVDPMNSQITFLCAAFTGMDLRRQSDHPAELASSC